MNFIKRAFLYLIHKKSNAIQILSIVTILFSLIIIAFTVRSAAEDSCDNIRQQLGSTVTLRHRSSYDVESASFITSGMADKISRLSNIKHMNRIALTYASAGSFTPIVSGDPAVNNKNGRSAGDLYLYGATDTELLIEFEEGTSKLVKGRHIEQTDSGCAVVLVEKSLAEKNSLKLGDKITVKAAGKEDKPEQLTIIGIYVNNAREGVVLGRAALQKGNKLYVPVETVFALSKTKNLDQIIFALADPIRTEEFIKDVKKAIKLPFNYKLDTNDTAYRRVAGPLENLIMICSSIVLIVTIAGALILTLIVVLSIKERKYEIGIMLSIGEGKLKIILQLLVEILVPVLLAAGLAAGIGYLVAKGINGNILKNWMQGIETTKVRPGMKDIVSMYLSGILLTMLSVTIPAILVIRTKPKDILIKIE